jgi:hypothetical protein
VAISINNAYPHNISIYTKGPTMDFIHLKLQATDVTNNIHWNNNHVPIGTKMRNILTHPPLPKFTHKTPPVNYKIIFSKTKDNNSYRQGLLKFDKYFSRFIHRNLMQKLFTRKDYGSIASRRLAINVNIFCCL